MQQSISSPAGSGAVAPAHGVRRCKGVPPTATDRRIDCDAEILEDRLITFASGHVIAPPCERCSAEIERRQGANAARTVRDAEAKLRQAAGLTRLFVSGTKSIWTIRALTPQHREAIDRINRLVRWTPTDGCRLNLRIVGDPGIGKTEMAEAYIAEVIAHGRSGLYVNARRFLSDLQDSFRDDSHESRSAMIRHHANITHLVYDDLGASKPTRFIADALYELFEIRTRNQLPTIVVSNYVSLSDLAQRLAPPDGDALDTIRPIDRIDELCPNVITLRGPSLRATISREGIG